MDGPLPPYWGLIIGMFFFFGLVSLAASLMMIQRRKDRQAGCAEVSRTLHGAGRLLLPRLPGTPDSLQTLASVKNSSEPFSCSSIPANEPMIARQSHPQDLAQK